MESLNYILKLLYHWIALDFLGVLSYVYAPIYVHNVYICVCECTCAYEYMCLHAHIYAGMHFPQLIPKATLRMSYYYFPCFTAREARAGKVLGTHLVSDRSRTLIPDPVLSFRLLDCLLSRLRAVSRLISVGHQDLSQPNLSCVVIKNKAHSKFLTSSESTESCFFLTIKEQAYRSNPP